MKKGVPISPGVALARAFRLDEALTRPAEEPLDPEEVADEIARYSAACEQVALELEKIIQRVGREVGDAAAAIFRSHRVLLRDPSLESRVVGYIKNSRLDVVSALHRTLDDYTAVFAHITDEYLRERMADIRDVVSRIIGNLTLTRSVEMLAGQDPVVLVAAEFLPSQAVMFERLPVAAIVTENGGSTGHAAILARSMGIPAVSGLKGLLSEVHTGDLLIVDGRAGGVLVNPGPEVESAYRKLLREYVDLKGRLIDNHDFEPISKDGVRIELLANVNSAADAGIAVNVGAGGVGLFRTEYVYLMHPSVPTEDEQLAAYRAVIDAAPNNIATIRTLDLGGDKQVPYIGMQREANPFMGWRSVRMTTEYPEFFRTQLRAILRAAVHGKVNILFPMIATIEEVVRLKKLVSEARAALVENDVPHAADVPFGVLVEVPAAAMCIDQILDEVDFVSIGSNDLIQYLMAADRDNPKVAHLCEPLHPAVFRTLSHIIKTCVKRNKPVTLCGEMAGRPLCLLPLLGMGLTRVSMSPAFVPTIKELVRTVNVGSAKAIARAVLRMRSAEEVRTYLSEQLARRCPKIAKLDTL